MGQAMQLIFFAEYRSKIEDDNLLVIYGGTNETYMKDAKIKAYVDGIEVEAESVLRDTNRSRFCYTGVNVLFSCEYQFVIPVSSDFKKAVLFVEFSKEYGGIVKKYAVSGTQYRKKISHINACVDRVKVGQDAIIVGGWAAHRHPVDINITHEGENVQCDIKKYMRNDIKDYFQENELLYDPCYEFVIPNQGWKDIDISFMTKDGEYIINCPVDRNLDKEKYTKKQLIAKGMASLKQQGVAVTWNKAVRKLFKNNKLDYDKWIKGREATPADLRNQKKTTFEYAPLMSIVVPVYRPKDLYFEEMLESILNQSYANWELCLADGSGQEFLVKESVDKIMGADGRVKYKVLEKNLGISGNTNEALDMATGDYIVLGDHDDIIRPDALYECVKAINEDREADMIYTDEDKYDCNSKKRVFPHFKPDFNLDMLRNNNYICHLFVFSRELYEKVGKFNSEYDGAQDYDFILRCSEKASKIKHIPKILYTWRSHENSTAKNPESKNYAYEAGTRALNAYFARNNIPAKAEMSDIPGYNDVTYDISGNPKISIIIPNKDHTDDLNLCLESIMKQDYENYEVIIIENNSVQKETFEYYKRAEEKYARVKVIYYEGEFNYSRINNYGIKYSDGEYILLLNNDTEMIKEDCLRHLLRFGCRPEIGIVGARLLYNDDTIQHAGVIIGMGGIAGHAFTGVPSDYPGYFARAVIPQNYSAVTAACMLVRRSVFEQVDGLDEDIKVAFNDVDFCLRVLKEGYLIAYNPYAELYHFESKSRGLEDTPEKVARFKREVDFMTERWGSFIEKGDPAFNPNLSLTRSDFSLKV